MQAVGRRYLRPSFTAACCKPRRPAVAWDAHRSAHNASQGNQCPEPTDTEGSPRLPDNGYTNIPIDFESKTVSTAVGQLPISPLMDPSFHEARQRFTKPKPKHSEHKPTKFQRHLARNPYAKALATPVRRCPITGVNLPSFFLQRFVLVSHPETGNPWFMPGALDSKAADTQDEGNHAEPESAEEQSAGTVHETTQDTQSEQEPDNSAQATPNSVEIIQEPAEPAVKTQNSTKTGPSGYVLSRQTLLQGFQEQHSVYFNGHKKLLRMSSGGATNLSALLANANWHSEMDVVVLELIRRRVFDALLYFAKKSGEEDRKYIVKCERWNDTKALKHRGCLLFLGQPEGATPESTPQYVPPRLSVMDVGPVKYGSKLAVHNLRVLLGEERIARLRQESELLSGGSLFLLGRQATVKLQMLLWKLQGYMSWDEAQKASSANSELER
ncbi:uncharacterized protein B0T15DRAFT_524031 [Chaetomium strumarium]|uniref:Uncharacterized protein n=1 Tax=Chaetomium strumarium TaxID=1170767 RepID=A0AAJ0GYV0_9PEZI|nr:hypothetical protein B0T15DRAFT_524031 [Chaetomium strumarium]